MTLQLPSPTGDGHQLQSLRASQLTASPNCLRVQHSASQSRSEARQAVALTVSQASLTIGQAQLVPITIEKAHGDFSLAVMMPYSSSVQRNSISASVNIA